VLQVLRASTLDACAQGIIGNSYNELDAVNAKPAAAMEGAQEEFRMDSFFSTTHAHNAFGYAPAKAPLRRRMLIESGHHASFPLHFSASGFALPAPEAEQEPEQAAAQVEEVVVTLDETASA
jgi:hypothetical protein